MGFFRRSTPDRSSDFAAVLSLIHPLDRATIDVRSLAPEAALRHLELAVVRRLEGFLQGDHLGFLPGPGSDSSDARPYVPGQDDVRSMDWAVTARTTLPHVRDTVADRELEVWALLDATPSMNWGSGQMTKRDLGIAAIAALGFISQTMGDRFGGMAMHSDGIRHFPARSGRQALYALLGRMLDDPLDDDTQHLSLQLADGIEAMSRTQRRRGMRIVVSDFIDTDDEIDPTIPPRWERALRRLAVRNQVICVEVVDAAEMSFPDVGEILIKDPESGFSRHVNTSDSSVRKRIDQLAGLQRQRIEQAMKRAGVGHIRLYTDRNWLDDIARFVIGYRRTAATIHQPPTGVSR